MGMSPAERQRSYRQRKEKQIAEMQAIPCQCGCGTLIPPINTNGKPAIYAHGHNPSGKRFQRGQEAWNKGQPNPKASEIHKGKKISPEELARRKITRLVNNNGVYQTKRGWKHTEQTIQRMTEAVNRRDLTGVNNPFYGRRHTPETIASLSEQFSGDNHPQWRGGTGMLPYGPEFTRKFKKLIRERDHYTCQKCGAVQPKGKTFHVHHVDENKANNDPQNLMTICPSCHVVLGWQQKKRARSTG